MSTSQSLDKIGKSFRSVAKYPQGQADGSRWCDNMDRYAQSFLYISMSTSQSLDKIGKSFKSVAKYPQRQADGYRWCDNVDRNAQSFLCISIVPAKHWIKLVRALSL